MYQYAVNCVNSGLRFTRSGIDGDMPVRMTAMPGENTEKLTQYVASKNNYNNPERYLIF